MARFLPLENTHLTVALPGELIRSQIKKVVTPDAVIVELIGEPLARLQHNYRLGDVVACRRTKTMFGEDWVAVDKRQISIEELVDQEKKDAAEIRRQPVNKVKKHSGAGEKRLPAKTSGSNKSIKRKKASKSK